MIGDETVQTAIIAKLKSTPTITTVLGGPNEIRELQWQGDEFTYPNIRVDLESNNFAFDEQERCNLQYVEFSIYIFSEERSSKQCSQIKTIVENALIGLGFSNPSLGIKFSRIRKIDSVPAIREDERTWRSQIRFGSRISTP